MSYFTRLGLEKVVQSVVDFSKVTIKHIEITEPQEDSFVFSLEAELSRTGPLVATVSTMTLDLAGEGGDICGQVTLGAFKITPNDTRITVKDQKVVVTNMPNFLSLVKDLIQKEQTELLLLNGSATVQSLAIKLPFKFSKSCPLAGLAGPRTEFISTTPAGDKVTARIYNPSPIVLDLGMATFQSCNRQGQALARQRGFISITKGCNEHELSMELTVSDDMVDAGDISMLQMVGADCEYEGRGGTWMKEAIKNYNVPLIVTPELHDLIRRKEAEELAERARKSQLIGSKTDGPDCVAAGIPA